MEEAEVEIDVTDIILEHLVGEAIMTLSKIQDHYVDSM